MLISPRIDPNAPCGCTKGKNHQQLLMLEVFSVTEGPRSSAMLLILASGTRASGITSMDLRVGGVLGIGLLVSVPPAGIL